MTNLPVIDVEAINQNELFEALNIYGFFYINNHGISETLQTNIQGLSREFFKESDKFKRQIAMEKSGLAWRGYFPVGGELTAGKPDIKEGIYFGAEHSNAELPLHGKNLWPEGEQYQAFKSIVLEYISELTKLGHKLMRSMALSLELDADFFEKKFTTDPTVLFYQSTAVNTSNDSVRQLIQYLNSHQGIHG